MAQGLGGEAEVMIPHILAWWPKAKRRPALLCAFAALPLLAELAATVSRPHVHYEVVDFEQCRQPWLEDENGTFSRAVEAVGGRALWGMRPLYELQLSSRWEVRFFTFPDRTPIVVSPYRTVSLVCFDPLPHCDGVKYFDAVRSTAGVEPSCI
jgi:hypothetical protein